MNSEEKIIISFLFKRSGKKLLSYSELYLNLSLDLKWFSPKNAKEFINKSLKNKILIEKGTLLTPTFDFKKISIPTDFFPSKNIYFINKNNKEKLNNKKQNIIKKIVRIISNISGETEEDINKKIENIEKEKNIFPEIAVLLISKEFNIALDEYFKEIFNKIIYD
jgi:hypothetical protein